MSRKKGVVFSAEQKTKIVLELLKEEQTTLQLANKYQVSTKSIQSWKKQFLENASLAFVLRLTALRNFASLHEPSKVVNEYKEELKAKEEEIERLQKTLGKTIVERDWAVKKLKSLDYKTKKALIKSELNVSISDQCDMLGINRSSFYYTPKPINESAIAIMHAIDEIYTNSSEYGYRQIHKQLVKNYGFSIGKERVLKYMRIMGIHALYPHRKKPTSIKDSEHKIYPYLLDKYWTKKEDNSKFVYVPAPNEVWSGDITYIRMNGGFMYLCAIIDWHTRAILSYKISNSMDVTLATDTLREAIEKYGTPKIFNSDQGSQYTSHQHTQILKDNGIEISMNCKGRSIDNIAIERFFRTLKHSNIYINDYKSVSELKEGIKEYIYKYNFKRFHSAIGYKQPMSYYLESMKKVA